MFTPSSFSQLNDMLAGCTAEDVDRALSAPHPDIHDLAALLTPVAVPYLQEMADRSAEITARRFGRTTQMYAPLYLANYCINRCRYCGFSTENKIDRRLLTFEEAEQEAMILLARGFNHILLVSGEAPRVLGVEYLEALAHRLRDRFASVTIEVQPLATEEYRRLFAAGITGVAVYQETYDRQVYDAVHVAGPKRDFDFRLDTPARAAGAGMREVGIGVLLGLGNWRVEGLALGQHLTWLRHHYWRTALTLSFPRLRPAAGDFTPLVQVGERELSQLIFALRIFDENVGIILSTREDPRYRDGMIGLGPTRYSAGSSTTPGGYGNLNLGGEQFAVGDHRSLEEVSAAIRQKGFDPVRKDWDAGFQVQ
jgi:2-iminoacetate synthase